MTRLEGDLAGRFALAECRLAGPHGTSTRSRSPSVSADQIKLRAGWWLPEGQAEAAARAYDAWRALANYRQGLWRPNPDEPGGPLPARPGPGQAGRWCSAARPLLDRSDAVRAASAAISRGTRPLPPRSSSAAGGPSLYDSGRDSAARSGLMAEARAWDEQSIRLDPDPDLRRRPALASIAEPEAAPALAGLPPRPPVDLPGPSAGRRGPREPSGRLAPVRGRRRGGGPRLPLRRRADRQPVHRRHDGRRRRPDRLRRRRLARHLLRQRLPRCPSTRGPLAARTGSSATGATARSRTSPARAGVGGRGYGMGCAVGDYDNDGHDDLFVTGLGGTVLYRNRGDGTFEDVDRPGRGRLDALDDRGRVRRPRRRRRPRPGRRHLRRRSTRAHVPDCRDPTGQADPLPARPVPAAARPPLPQQRRRHVHRRRREAGLRRRPAASAWAWRSPTSTATAGSTCSSPTTRRPTSSSATWAACSSRRSGSTAGVAYDGNGRATASMGVVADDLDGDGRIDLFHTNFLNEPNTFLRNLGGGLFADATAGAPGSTPRAGRSPASAPPRSTPTTTAGSTCSSPTATSTTGPGSDHPMAQLPHFYRSVAGGRFERRRPRHRRLLRPARRRPGRGGGRPRQRRPGRPGRRPPRRPGGRAPQRDRCRPLARPPASRKPRPRSAPASPAGPAARTVVDGSPRGRDISQSMILAFGSLRISRSVDTLEIRWPSGSRQKGPTGRRSHPRHRRGPRTRQQISFSRR